MLQAPESIELCDEPDRYLSMDSEHVVDTLVWWYEHRNINPHLHWMALDYLSATSLSVECTFSQGQLLLLYIHNWLLVQSTQALLCLGVWSLMGYVKDKDMKAVTVLAKVGPNKEADLVEASWNVI